MLIEEITTQLQQYDARMETLRQSVEAARGEVMRIVTARRETLMQSVDFSNQRERSARLRALDKEERQAEKKLKAIERELQQVRRLQRQLWPVYEEAMREARQQKAEERLATGADIKFPLEGLIFYFLPGKGKRG
jgi:hypothetical protein